MERVLVFMLIIQRNKQMPNLTHLGESGMPTRNTADQIITLMAGLQEMEPQDVQLLKEEEGDA